MENVKTKIKTGQRIEYGIYQFLDHFLGRGRVFKVLGKRRNIFYKNLEKDLEKSGEGKAIEIERRIDLSLKEFRKNYLKKGIPVIMEGAAKEWSCVKKWSLDYFKDLYGNDETVINDDQDRNKYEFMTLAAFINNIKEGGDKYLRFYPLLKRHPELIEDFDHKWLIDRRNSFSLLEEFKVAIGGRNTGTSLHNENTQNLFIQVYGEKKWIIYPPSDSPVIDPPPVRNAYRGVGKVLGPDLFNPKFDAPNNRYRYINRFETLLKPGDVLWVPPFYWHTVVNANNSIGVGYRWFNPFTAFRSAPLYMFLDLFANKPPIWKTFKLYKEDINILLIAEKGKLAQFRKEQKERTVLVK